MQSFLTYKVRLMANGQWPMAGGSGKGAPGSPKLFLGQGFWTAEGGLPQGFIPHQPLRSPAAAPAYHPALWTGKMPHLLLDTHTHLELSPSPPPILNLHLGSLPPSSCASVSGALFTLTLLHTVPPHTLTPGAPPLQTCPLQNRPLRPSRRLRHQEEKPSESLGEE